METDFTSFGLTVRVDDSSGAQVRSVNVISDHRDAITETPATVSVSVMSPMHKMLSLPARQHLNVNSDGHIDTLNAEMHLTESRKYSPFDTNTTCLRAAPSSCEILPSDLSRSWKSDIVAVSVNRRTHLRNFSASHWQVEDMCQRHIQIDIQLRTRLWRNLKQTQLNPESKEFETSNSRFSPFVKVFNISHVLCVVSFLVLDIPPSYMMLSCSIQLSAWHSSRHCSPVAPLLTNLLAYPRKLCKTMSVNRF